MTPSLRAVLVITCGAISAVCAGVVAVCVGLDLKELMK